MNRATLESMNFRSVTEMMDHFPEEQAQVRIYLVPTDNC